ncbi:response regulator transcription factor [Pseudarthrobacter sp. N5]|uniref:response regulator transcription factor n=1 Tax=Pseudarthrobacter sp. N5 TaxID=3418416 RepID=UPI003CEDE7A2
MNRTLLLRPTEAIGNGSMGSRGICLVIEDDEDIQGLVSVILSGAGFDVHPASTGAAGIAAAGKPDLALITRDLGLPDLDGLVAACHIRNISGASIMFLTARAGPGDELAGLASGAAAYLTKPFRPKQLTAPAARPWPVRPELSGKTRSGGP